jgi:hypothetical protein
VVWIAEGRSGKLWTWINQLRARRPFNVVVVARLAPGADHQGRRGAPRANQLARIIWALLARGEAYRAI